MLKFAKIRINFELDRLIYVILIGILSGGMLCEIKEVW